MNGALQPTIVLDTLWKFAAERHRIYLNRLNGNPQPWTQDLILQNYKFTNAFRACDRVSQYLIKEVIYEPTASTEPEEVVFRVLLFKLFNSIPAWEALKATFGIPTWKGFNEQAYGQVLGSAWSKGANIWNAAYMQNDLSNYAQVCPQKHPRYLRLLKDIMSTNVTGKLQAARTYRDAFQVLYAYPLHKGFIGMQHLTDLNYSSVINFDEDDFIVPGPGAYRGLQKCWSVRLNEPTAMRIIRECVNDQQTFFQAVGEQPVTLFGRRLHAIDIQNLYCETDKYARVAHPSFSIGPSPKPQKPKQTLKPTGPLPKPFFPPKWVLTQSPLTLRP